MRIRWSIGYFGVKDIFTIINLVGGALGIHYAMQGRLDWAAHAILAGYLFGDALDGQVARWTKTGNRFGGEFDKITDHLAQTIAPAILLYKAYAMGGRDILGIVLMSVVITGASIRHARMATAPFNYPYGYCGLNRTVSGLIALALPNAELFFKQQPWGYDIGAIIVVIMAILNLAPIPYMSHRGERKMQPYVKALAVMFVTAPLALFIFQRQYLYDFIFVCTFGYALTAWIPVLPQERRAFYDEYRRWASEVARK
jgi:phosphatidylserine synthase